MKKAKKENKERDINDYIDAYEEEEIEIEESLNNQENNLDKKNKEIKKDINNDK